MRTRNHMLSTDRPGILSAMIFVVLYFPMVAHAQSSVKQKDPLFLNDAPLELVIETDLGSLIEDKSDEPEYQQAKLSLYENNKKVREFAIKIRARGHSRRLYDYCDFPPLKLNLRKKETANTVFQGQDKIKLVTTCREQYTYNQSLFQEYLIYKTYNELTDASLNVRLVHIKYIDAGEKTSALDHYGFLIEDDDAMAKRIGGSITERTIWHPDSCEQESTDLLSLFQFMIGNTDWWIHTRHNVKLVSCPGKGLIPVPYDFDLSGVISTPYARPNTSLPIKHVRERFYKGCCRTSEAYDPIIDHFNDKKDAIVQIYSDCEWLERAKKKQTLKYYDEFYTIINDHAKTGEYLLSNCVNSDGIFTSGNNPK